MANSNRSAVSLFCSGGIADLALRASGHRILLANELLEDRADVYSANYPETHVIVGDIREKKQDVINAAKALLAGDELDLLFATPPCQGMSKNGRGKLLSLTRSGARAKLDPRNQLIIDSMDIVTALRPRTVLLENVPEMQTTLIADRDGSLIGLLEFVRRETPAGYRMASNVVEFADYGVPQRRQRLITVLTRDEKFANVFAKDPAKAFPTTTHSKHGGLLTKTWVTVEDRVGTLPPLDASSAERATSDVPFHRVPTLDRDKYFWVSNTPPGKGAFDNQCVNPDCGFDRNPTHGSSHGDDGVNRAHKNTPIRCVRCGELLPRPWVKEKDGHRLMSGYTSAYKRMRGDLPSSALTRNLSYACSDQKLHPTQHRVLSLKEAFLLHTIEEFDWTWQRASGKKISDMLIRELVGESVPPLGLLPFFQRIAALTVSANRGYQSATG